MSEDNISVERQKEGASITSVEEEHKPKQGSIKMDASVHTRLRAIYDDLNADRKQTGIYYTLGDIVGLLIDFYEEHQISRENGSSHSEVRK